MKNKVMSFVSSILIGIGIGMPTTTLVMILIGGYNSVMKEFIVWLVASALFGVVSNLFFDNNRFNLLVATVLHFVCCFAVTICAGTICGYGDGIMSLILGIGPVFVIVYAVIYLLSFMGMRAEAKKVNNALDERK